MAPNERRPARWIMEMQHLSREISGKRVVDDINIQVERAEIFTIVGPSGSGGELEDIIAQNGFS
jgi:ABC-type transporter Mla maintaining outer membrane lipid asymmetry ATPase subunit MlaF